MPVDEAIILAGGRGTRLRAVVSDVPKPLAPVAGRPFLAWVLDQLANEGVRRVILATGHLAEQVEETLGTRWRGMELDYSVEGGPLGTGGAIRLAARKLRGDGAHVLNGDTFLRYSPFALESTARTASLPMAVALASVDDAARYGSVVVADGRLCAFEEKGKTGPGLINAGSYFLDGTAMRGLDAFPQAFSFETEVLVPQAVSGNVAAFTETEDFIDIGVPEDYRRAQTLFGARN